MRAESCEREPVRVPVLVYQVLLEISEIVVVERREREEREHFFNGKGMPIFLLLSLFSQVEGKAYPPVRTVSPSDFPLAGRHRTHGSAS